MNRRAEITSRQRLSTTGWNTNKKLAKVGVEDMKEVKGGENRPGEWRIMLKANAHTRDVPAVVEDQIIEEIADGKQPKDLEEKMGLARGSVKRVLIRKFGGVEQMKKALELQCMENAIIFNEVAASKSDEMNGAQAAVAAKIMVDAGLSLGKARAGRSYTVDFDALQRLGDTLDRVEKRLSPEQVREVEVSFPTPPHPIDAVVEPS